MDPKIVIEGDLKFRGTRKWRPRWAIVTRLSPVADCLHLQLYRDQKERIKSGLTKSSLSLEKFIGLETGFTLDKESNTLALICQDMVLLLALNSRETLLHWQTTIRNHLPQEHQYPVEIIQFPAKSKLTIGPSRLHIRDGLFALVSSNPPRLSGLWHLPDLRRYGVLNGKFCFEGGSSCGKGEGLHVLQTLQTGELMKAFQLASIGNLQPKRKLSTIKRDKCNNNNNLSDRISFCSSSSHSSGTSSISSGNGSYQSSLEYSTPRPSISGHHHHGHHHGHSHGGGNGSGLGECSNCSGGSSVEIWYDRLKMLRSANSGLMLFNGCGGGGGGSSSLCSCLSESNLTTTTLDATIDSNGSENNDHRIRNHHHHDTFDCQSTASSTNTLKRTTYNSSHGSESGSTNGITVDPRVLHKLITGHYQIPKSFLCNQGKNLIDSEEDKINLINNLEMYDVPRKFQQIHLNSSTDLKQSVDCQQETVNGVNNKTSGLDNITKQSTVINTGLTSNSVNCEVVDDKTSKVDCPDDEMIIIVNGKSFESTTIKSQTADDKINLDQKSDKLLVNCDENHSMGQSKSKETNLINNSQGLPAINLNLKPNGLKVSTNTNHKANCCLINPTINNNYANIDFVRSLQYYQNVGLLKKQLNTTINSTTTIKPAANLPESSSKQQSTTVNDVNQVNCDYLNQKQDKQDDIKVNYNLMVNKSTDCNSKNDDYLEMIPLLISDDCRSESDLSDHNQTIYQYYLNQYHHHLNQLENSNRDENCSNIFLIMKKDQSNNQQFNTSASSSSTINHNDNQVVGNLINPLSRSLSDLRRKLWSRVKSIDGQQLRRENQLNHLSSSSSSCPSSPRKLSSQSTNYLNHESISLSTYDDDEHLILSLPIPPPPPPPPLSYLFACRLNKSIESLLTLNDEQLTNCQPNYQPASFNCHNHEHLTSSDEDIYHASQIRVTSSSPFDCRPMSPSEIKRSISLPNDQQSSTIKDKFNLHPINMVNNDQQLTATTNTMINSHCKSNEKCNNNNQIDDNLINNNLTLNDLNKSTINNCYNQNGKSSNAILIKSQLTNDVKGKS
ncbi:putative uncharacterized protein DDB_G0289263 [Panonychus citri]|uniref:putative uncharacterized protein DDB_G0289263 n=1 Tax=Panonychus citri TaxID=50023 RepID=UPI00230822FE|nr:putative uncharacterized protein DDB_G0289263 [Panonychus citri]